MIHHSKKINLGFSLIEVIIAASIIGASMMALLSAYSYLIRIENESPKMIKADYLLEEGIEAARYLRDKGWTSNIAGLSTAADYYLYLSLSNGVADWQATATKQIYDNSFERKINFGGVYRDNTTKDISAPSVNSSLDVNTKKITVTVSWIGTSGTTTKSLSTYLTNINGN